MTALPANLLKCREEGFFALIRPDTTLEDSACRHESFNKGQPQRKWVRKKHQLVLITGKKTDVLGKLRRGLQQPLKIRLVEQSLQDTPMLSCSAGHELHQSRIPQQKMQTFPRNQSGMPPGRKHRLDMKDERWSERTWWQITLNSLTSINKWKSDWRPAVTLAILWFSNSRWLSSVVLIGLQTRIWNFSNEFYRPFPRRVANTNQVLHTFCDFSRWSSASSTEVKIGTHLSARQWASLFRAYVKIPNSLK